LEWSNDVLDTVICAEEESSEAGGVLRKNHPWEKIVECSTSKSLQGQELVPALEVFCETENSIGHIVKVNVGQLCLDLYTRQQQR
jgi:hypothetical protein